MYSVCDNCGWEGGEDKLAAKWPLIPDLFQRVEPGQEIPAGECPKCGALTYRDDYRAYTRTFYNVDPDTGERARHLGDKDYLTHCVSREQAHRVCKEWNEANPPGPTGRKAEFEKC